jgi:peptidoglycan lytic transglycosylase G
VKRILAVLIALILLAAAGGAYLYYTRIGQPYRGYSEAEQFVEIPTGMGSRAIGQQLVSAGIVRDDLTYRIALWRSGAARRLKAGEYRFDRAMTPLDVIDKIARGDVVMTTITFREGLTIQEMSQVFDMAGVGPAATFVEAARDASLIADVDSAARDLEGYLFPDTYSFPRKTDAPRVVRAMVDRFHHVLTPELKASADARGMTVRQLVTLASIVEKETGRAEERPLIAAVYANRLRIGMPLQCDPTVIYALLRTGQYNGNLRRDDLMLDSPYNTYRYPGLPPGPIAAPGKGSLEAAAKPAAVEYLYFVSRNDGSHEFARTLEEHNRNVEKFQRQYFRDLRAQGR